MNKNITVIVTLYKTPLSKLNNLTNYKNYKLLIFEQEGNSNSKKKISNILNFKFRYFFNKRNIGLTKSSNLLLKKVKTKYCLFTQADINISSNSILKLFNIIKYKKESILITPNLSKKKNNKIFKFVKKINAACVLFDVKKIKKIGFFDEDYFLYWEDIDLIQRINKSNYKMISSSKIYAHHDGSQSSKNDSKVLYLRSKNFTYGEFVYDYKNNKLRFIKIIRKFIQNLFLFFFNIIRFQLKDSLKNLANLNGILKFIFYYLKKI
jgi:GT2 family glycosyltransferase